MSNKPIEVTTDKRAKRDLLIIAFANIIAYFIFAEIDALEWLYETSLAHEHYELDKIFFLTSTLTVSFIIFTFQRYTEGKQLLQRLHTLSIQDSLTGLFNRRYMDNMLTSEIERTKRSNSTFSLLIVDIDYFKKINDNYGHNTGDEVLITFSELLMQFIRKSDVAARWGGEEFLILCPNTTPSGSNILGSNLLKAVQKRDFGAVGHITASIGVVTYDGSESALSIINRADVCLYQAKEAGRNRVVTDA